MSIALIENNLQLLVKSVNTVTSKDHYQLFLNGKKVSTD